MKKIVAFTVIKNGNRLGYPWLESIHCVLPFVDQFLIQEGYSDDDTFKWAQRLALKEPKVYVTRFRWPAMATGFAIGAATNRALDVLRATDADICWLVQSDELYHPQAARQLADAFQSSEAEGFSVDFLHLCNNYQEVQQGAGYQRAIRAVQNRPWIRSHRDAWTMEGCQLVLDVTLDPPLVHANRIHWHNIPLKLRNHADALYRDLPWYHQSALDAEALYGSGIVPDLFTRSTSPFDAVLPEIVKPLIGKLQYEPREELVA